MIICIDWGGSLTKVVVKYKSEPDKPMEFKRFREEFPYEYINNKIEEHRKNGNITDVKVLVTGVRQKKVKKENIKAEVIFLNEIESIGNMVNYCGFEKGLVVSIGTGTPFVYNDGNRIHHINGTGLGGGTFAGLASRMLGTDDASEIEAMAGKGDISRVNITMSDVSEDSVSWLKQDYTCSNFGKTGETGETKEDIALGIHSLVAEPIGCMAAACAMWSNTNVIIFIGTLSENKVVQKILNTCLDIYGLEGIFPENSGYGTCLGAISLYERGE